MVESLKILLLTVAAAICFGIVHDQFTARICVEYFTIGHPPVFNTQSPTLLALGWGVIATWWVGVILGIPLACAARLGARPKFSAAMLLRPIATLLAIMAVLCLISGTSGYFAGRSGAVVLIDPGHLIDAGKHPAYLADLWSHLAAYAVGFLGGLVLCVWTYGQRRKIEAS